MSQPGHWARRMAGGLLLLLTLLPFHRSLAGAGGLAADQTARAAEGYFLELWTRGGSVLGAVLVVAWLLGGRREQLLGALRRMVLRPSPPAFAAMVASVAVALTVAACFGVFAARPVFNDSMAQLVHARYLAAGRLAGPTLDQPVFWTMQFMLNTDAGWVSQYPPGHVVALALGLLAGVPWLVGPVLSGATAVLTYAAGRRLFGEGGELPARAAGILMALSPFAAGLAGAYMSHVTAGALGTLAVYCATRVEGRSAWAWGAMVGAALGAMGTVRPYSALVLGGGAVVAAWSFTPSLRPPGPRGWLLRGGHVLLGALPFGVALALYNQHFFGSPWTFGYTVTAGPSHRLGFHVDPWGAPYGPAQAWAYTSAEVRALGMDLLGTPIPVTLLAGLWLVAAARLRAGEAVVVAWALLPALGNAFYWHHDLVLGPRMLGEAAPAWILLTVAAAWGATRGPDATDGTAPAGATWRSMVRMGLLTALLSGAWFGPQEMRAAARRIDEPVRAPPAVGEPALVFVADGWMDRLGARLSARGVRADSVRALLQSTPPCRIQSLLDGSRTPLLDECRRQASVDRLGTLSIAPLLWQGDLPGLDAKGAMWVRNLGWGPNAALLERYPERQPLVLLPPGAGRAAWSLAPYADGMALVWGPAPEPEAQGVPLSRTSGTLSRNAGARAGISPTSRYPSRRSGSPCPCP